MALGMSSQLDRLLDRSHCHASPVTLPSSSTSTASKRVSSQPRSGEMLSTPASSTSVTVTVTSRLPVRPSGSSAVTLIEKLVVPLS